MDGDTALPKAYLEPVRRRPNLQVETHAFARKLILDGKRVVGVRYDVKGVEIEARAGSEVLLTAGAVQSPQLLEVSGIGAPAVLKEHGLAVQTRTSRCRRELPGPLRSADRMAR